jgi:chemotaxis protein MotB
LDGELVSIIVSVVPKHTFTIASILSVLAIIGFISISAVQQRKVFQGARNELAEAKARIEEVSKQASGLQEQLDQSKARIDELEKEKQEVTAAQKHLEDQMRSELESKDVTISELQGKLTVNILDRILFDSGEAELKPEGQAVLQQIAGILAKYPNRQIHVIGHTDNVPIRGGRRFQSNWELSSSRALAAVRFLSEKAGVDPHRLAAVGFGEFHPVADNSTLEGRAKNRRIALVVMPEEFGPVDALAPPTPKALPAPLPMLSPEVKAEKTNDNGIAPD